MRYSYVAAPLALAAGASAWGNGTIEYTTEIVTAFTTFCPYSTSFTHASSTYIVTEATTLTITDCPCTVTKPVVSSTPVITPTSVAPDVSVTPSVSETPVAATSSPAEVATTAPATTAAPVVSVPVSVAPVGTAPPSVPSGSVVPPTFANTTVPVGTAPVGTAPATGSVAPAKTTVPFTGAANKMAASGVSLAALLGLAAYLL